MRGYLGDRGYWSWGHRQREPELGSLRRAVRLRLPREEEEGAVTAIRMSRAIRGNHKGSPGGLPEAQPSLGAP